MAVDLTAERESAKAVSQRFNCSRPAALRRRLAVTIMRTITLIAVSATRNPRFQ